MLLGKRGMELQAPLFVRIFKEESELEVWKQRNDGRFYHFKTYPICNWSGELGPKLRQGDKQAPEGFYRVDRNLMNPNSQFHLAFNLGYPNAYDAAHNRTGDFLMVHGKCESAGCYAMTDALIEEIYALARESFLGGQEFFHVHAMPFRMTHENMARHAGNRWMPFWETLKQGYDHFEQTRIPPEIVVCERQYFVNMTAAGRVPGRIAPAGRCPRLEQIAVTPFTPTGEQKKLADAEQIVMPGPRRRSLLAQSQPARDVRSASSTVTDTFGPMTGLGGPAHGAQ